MASSKPTPASRPYFSNGQALSAPPFSARARQFGDHMYNTLGLYFTSFFSLDSYSAAEASKYNVNNRSAGMRRGTSTPRSGGGGGGGGGSGGGWGDGKGGGGGGGKKLGTVDDVRGPECKSCQ